MSSTQHPAQQFARTVHAPAPATAERSPVREGIVAGLVAAASVALVFLGQDLEFGDPLRTVTQLGHGLLSLLGVGAAASASVPALASTAFHVAAFVLFGIAAAATTRLARREPGVLAGSLLLFAVLEVAYVGALMVARASTLTGALAWDEMLVGNVVGSVSLGAVLWRGHPELRGELTVAMGAAE